MLSRFLRNKKETQIFLNGIIPFLYDNVLTVYGSATLLFPMFVDNAPKVYYFV